METTTTNEKRTITVSAAVSRVRRKLAKEGTGFRTNRGEWNLDLRCFYAFDLNRNTLEWAIDFDQLEATARELGVLGEHERVEAA